MLQVAEEGGFFPCLSDHGTLFFSLDQVDLPFKSLADLAGTFRQMRDFGFGIRWSLWPIQHAASFPPVPQKSQNMEHFLTDDQQTEAKVHEDLSRHGFTFPQQAQQQVL